ncbi:MAG: hypothetical protein N2249_03400 [Melioribacter sp.]|nr:hypothetical protein [Melioribacter sp.]
MAYKMKKAVDEIIASLKKLPEPGKKTGSFWNFMKGQLTEESQWDPEHIKIIENEIDKYLTKLDKKSLTEMWKETPAGSEKYDMVKKADIKEMKADITDELIGKVMDRMDERYSSRDSFYFESEESAFAGKKKKSDDEEDIDEDFDEAEDFSNEDFRFDDDIFNEEDDEDDYSRY